VTCANFLGPLFTDWVSGCYVIVVVLVSPRFIVFWLWQGGGGRCACPLVLRSLLLLSVLGRLRLV